MSEKSMSASTSNGRVGDITDAKCLHMVANSKAADLIVAGAFVKNMRGSVTMPEKEYISIQKLLELKSNFYDFGHYDLGDLDMFLDDIKEHFVDAVEVVRCKDCIHRYVPARCALWVGNENGKDIFLERGDDFFCKYGERKDTDDTK